MQHPYRKTTLVALTVPHTRQTENRQFFAQYYKLHVCNIVCHSPTMCFMRLLPLEEVCHPHRCHPLTSPYHPPRFLPQPPHPPRFVLTAWMLGLHFVCIPKVCFILPIHLVCNPYMDQTLRLSKGTSTFTHADLKN